MPAACVLIAVALVPTLIHSYAGAVVVDGRTAAGIPSFIEGFTSTPSGRDETWGKRRFDSDDWIERRYLRGNDEVRLTVVRSYDPKSLYHHPELAVAYRTNFEAAETWELRKRPDIPIHVLKPAPGSQEWSMYVLHYDDRFIDDPVMFQIRTAGELLVGRRKPMTLFFALVPGNPPDGTLDDVGAAQLLLAAIDGFLGQHPDGTRDTE
jgi:hypothetical protein